jgi:putative hemolysin
MLSSAILAMLNRELTAGSLQVRMAQSPQEVDAAQDLRYRVFYEEMGAKPSPEVLSRKRDFDAMDQYCDHLLVLDNDRSGPNKVVGTYRLIRREHAAKNGSFY